VRPLHTAELDKVRPVLVLTRELVRPHLARVTVAPITRARSVHSFTEAIHAAVDLD
jgi:mRNA interferase MazF